MPKDTIVKTKIKQSTYFDFKELYSFAYDWLEEEGFDISEEKYAEKVSGSKKNIDIKWKASKKITDYFKFIIKLEWKILGLESVEIMKDGKKNSTNKGNFEIKISAILERDYDQKWEDSPFMKFLRGVYDKYIIKGAIEAQEDKIIGITDELVSQIKAMLSIEGK